MKLFSLPVALLLSLSISESLAHTKTAVEDAIDQSSKLHRCWVPVKTKGSHTRYVLSEPIYEMCIYMPDPANWNKFYVNGVNEESDDYTTIHSIFAVGSKSHQTLTVCLQEAFQFETSPAPSQVSLRCLCKRNGCNVPKTITHFLDENRLSLQQFEF